MKLEKGNKGFAFSKNFYINALDTSYEDLKLVAMKYSPAEASYVPTSQGVQLSSKILYQECAKCNAGDTVMSLNLDSNSRIWIYASRRGLGNEWFYKFDFQILEATQGFLRIERPRIAAMPIPLWQSSEVSPKNGSWNNCTISSRKICNGGDVESPLLISFYKNKFEIVASSAFSLSSFNSFTKNKITLDLCSSHNASLKVAKLHFSGHKTKKKKRMLFQRSSPSSSSSSSSSLLVGEKQKETKSLHQEEQQQYRNVELRNHNKNEVALYEVNRRGSIVPVEQTSEQTSSPLLEESPFVVSCNHIDRQRMKKEHSARLETLNRLFLDLEDNRPRQKLVKHEQLQVIENEMNHLLSLRVRRKRRSLSDDDDYEVEMEKHNSKHLIAYHSKKKLVRKRHERTDDAWSKPTRHARENVFLRHAVKQFRSHTQRHNMLYASKHVKSVLETPNLDEHWAEKSRVQTKSFPDDGSWYEQRFGTKQFVDENFAHDIRNDRVVGWKRITNIFDSPMMKSSIAFVFRDDFSFKCKRIQFQEVHEYENAEEMKWKEDPSDLEMRERYQLMKDLAEEAAYSMLNESSGPMIALMDTSVSGIVRNERFLDIWKRMRALALPAKFSGVTSKIEVRKDKIFVHVLLHFHRPAPCLFQRHHNHSRDYEAPGNLSVGCVRNIFSFPPPSSLFSLFLIVIYLFQIPNRYNLVGALMMISSHPYVLSNLFPRVKEHQTFNESGMYAVRLFLEGQWRVVVVDDFLPVDQEDQPACVGFGYECTCGWE